MLFEATFSSTFRQVSQLFFTSFEVLTLSSLHRGSAPKNDLVHVPESSRVTLSQCYIKGDILKSFFLYFAEETSTETEARNPNYLPGKGTLHWRRLICLTYRPVRGASTIMDTGLPHQMALKITTFQ